MAVIPIDELKQRPAWLRVRVPTGENYAELKALMRGKALHTVCEEVLRGTRTSRCHPTPCPPLCR
jgi:lipoate synthase